MNFKWEFILYHEGDETLAQIAQNVKGVHSWEYSRSGDFEYSKPKNSMIVWSIILPVLWSSLLDLGIQSFHYFSCLIFLCSYWGVLSRF